MRKIQLSEEELVKLARKAGYNKETLAKLCHVSVRQLQRDFRHRFELQPREWLDRLRMKNATILLLSDHPVKNVAADLGYKHSSHFCRKFKQFTGATPTAFVIAQPPPARNVAQG